MLPSHSSIMRMMRIPAVWTTNLVALLFGAGLYAVFAFLPEFIQTPSECRLRLRRRASPRAGLIVLPIKR